MGCCNSASENSSGKPNQQPEQILDQKQEQLFTKFQSKLLLQSIINLKSQPDLDQSQIQKYEDLHKTQISSQVFSCTLSSENPTDSLEQFLILSSTEPKEDKIQGLNSLIIQQALSKDQIETIIQQISSQSLTETSPEVHFQQTIHSLKQEQQKNPFQKTEIQPIFEKQKFKEEVLDSFKLRQALQLASSRQFPQEILYQPENFSQNQLRLPPKVSQTPQVLYSNFIYTEASESESPLDLSNYIEESQTRNRANSYNTTQNTPKSKFNKSVFDSAPRMSLQLTRFNTYRSKFKKSVIQTRTVRSGHISRKRSPQVFTIRYNYKVGQETKKVQMKSSEDPVRFGHQFSVKNGFNLRQRDGLIKKLKELKSKASTSK